MMTARRIGEFYRKILILFLLVCAMPVSFLAAFSFRETARKAARETRQRYDQTAGSLVAAMTGRFEEICSLGQRMKLTPWVARLRSNSDILYQGVSFNRLSEIRQEIMLYEILVGVTNQIGVYLPNRGMSVTKNGLHAAGRASTFPLELTVTDNDILWPLLKSESSGFSVYNLADTGISQAKANDCIVACRLDDLSEPRAVLYCCISGSTMDKFLFSERPDGLVSFVVSIDDSPLFTYYFAPESDARYSVRQTAQVAHCVFSCEIVFDGSLYPGGAAVFGTLYAVLALVILVSLVLTLLLTNVAYRPIRRLADKTGASSLPDYDELAGIENQYDLLHNQSADLKRQLEQYEAVVRNQFLLSLLHGLFVQEDRTNVKLRLSLRPDAMYQVIVMRRGAFTEDSVEYARALVELEQSGIGAELTKDEENDWVLIFEARDADTLETLFAKEPESFESFRGFPYPGILGISKSYLGVRQLTRLNYFYPTDWEIQLIHQLKQGSGEVALRILDQIREENERREADEKSLSVLLSALTETLLRVASELGLSHEMLLAQGADEVDPWQRLSGMALALSRYAGPTDEEDSDSFCRRLLAYVNEHYREPDMSLGRLQEVFSYSQPVLSRAFKKAARLNYYDYLSRLRIEEAKVLMTEKEMPLSRVAEAVGYTSEVAFQRVFKRYQGISPRDYMAACSQDMQQTDK